MPYPDAPITKPEEDLFNRSTLAKDLARIISDWDQKHSLVIAISDRWGNGKTSVLNLIKFHLENQHRIKGRIRLKIHDFNPWSDAHSNEYLISTNFDTLAYNSCSFKRLWGKLPNLLRRYSLIFSPRKSIGLDKIIPILIALSPFLFSKYLIENLFKLVWIPVSAIVVIQFIPIVIAIILYYALWRDIYWQEKTIGEYKNIMAKSLDKSKIRIVEFIDDVDRLPSDEILTLLRMIKCHSDLPRCVYILSFDKEVVAKRIRDEANPENGTEFLQKVVQLWVDLPPIPPNIAMEFFENRFISFMADTNLLDSYKEQLDHDEHYLVYLRRAGLFDLIDNLRCAKSILSNLTVTLPQLINGDLFEINIIDFIAIEIIRFVEPSYYMFIRENKALFTNSSNDDLDLRDQNEWLKDNKPIYEKGLGVLPQTADGMKILNVSQVMFPGISVYSNDFDLSSSIDEQEMNHKQRICHPNHFDKYFSYNFEEVGDKVRISDIRIMSSSGSEQEIQSILFDYLGKNLFQAFVERLSLEIDKSSRFEEGSLLLLLKVCFDISDSIPRRQGGGIFDIPSNLILNFLIQTITMKFDKAKRSQILNASMRASEGIYGPVSIVNTIISRDPSNPLAVEIVSPQEADELKERVVGLIREKQGSLINSMSFGFILRSWIEWDTEEHWGPYLEQIYENNLRIIKLLSNFHGLIVDSDGERITFKVHDLYSEQHFDVDLIAKRLTDLKKANSDMYQINKDLIDTYLSDYGIYQKNKK